MTVTAKPWYQSRAVIGGAVAAFSGIAAMFGIAVDESALTEIVLSVGSLIGGALAIYGRIKADRPIQGMEKKVNGHA